MRVAITAQGAALEAAVDSRFGRAKYFVVCDTDTGAVTYHNNEQNLNAMQGAGIQAAQQVVSLGVEAVLTGNVGPKAFMTLEAGNVKPYIGASGTVAEALDAFKAGKYACAQSANVEGHWM